MSEGRKTLPSRKKTEYNALKVLVDQEQAFIIDKAKLGDLSKLVARDFYCITITRCNKSPDSFSIV